MYVNPARVEEIGFKYRRVSIRSLRFHDNGEVEVAVRERLPLQKADSYGDGIFKLVPRWDSASVFSGIVLTPPLKKKDKN
jgi:hypothetical protein